MLTISFFPALSSDPSETSPCRRDMRGTHRLVGGSPGFCNPFCGSGTLADIPMLVGKRRLAMAGISLHNHRLLWRCDEATKDPKHSFATNNPLLFSSNLSWFQLG